MSFTDDDLKRLKESLKEHPEWWEHTVDFYMESLIARLEAAENLLSLFTKAPADTEIDGSDFDRAMETWRKEAGK